MSHVLGSTMSLLYVHTSDYKFSYVLSIYPYMACLWFLCLIYIIGPAYELFHISYTSSRISCLQVTIWLINESSRVLSIGALLGLVNMFTVFYSSFPIFCLWVTICLVNEFSHISPMIICPMFKVCCFPASNIVIFVKIKSVTGDY